MQSALAKMGWMDIFQVFGILPSLFKVQGSVGKTLIIWIFAGHYTKDLAVLWLNTSCKDTASD